MSLTKASFSMITGAPFNVLDYGAKGDGTTDDTAAIKLAITAITANGGGTLYFPATGSTYVIPKVTGATIVSYRSVFELSSNTYVEMQPGASITFNGVTSGGNYMGLFGVNWSNLPVANIGFINCTFIQTKPLPGSTEQLQAIQFAFAPDAANGSLQYARVTGCNFTYCGIYMVNRLTGANAALYADRQTQNVLIDNCIAKNNASQFVTADVNTCTISNCLVSGPIGDTTESYDGVSIHSGFNINIVNNVFTQIHVGQVINVRDSVENGCGSKNINILGNTIYSCTATAAIQLATSGSPAANQGVFNVTISGNTIYDCVSGIIISRAGTSGLSQISITGNIITADAQGIFCSQPIASAVEDLLISNNCIRMISTATNAAITLQAVIFGTVTGNDIVSDSVSSSYQMAYFAGCQELAITGNNFYTAATSSSGVLKVGDTSKLNTNLTFNSNIVYCESNFSNFTSGSKVYNNLFAVNPVVNGNTLTGGRISLDNGNTSFTSSAFPTTGTWVQGDIVYNSAPAAGGSLGWICTTAGTSGTWKTFGAIAA